MKRLLASVFAISLLGFGGSALADDGSGYDIDERGAQSAAVTVTVPATAFRGDVVTVSVTYPTVDPTNVRCFLLLPVTDPTIYTQELKAYVRQSNQATAGASCPFYIPDFVQIEGTAITFVTVDGQGSDFATFEIFP
jgi:hypothetical protein